MADPQPPPPSNDTTEQQFKAEEPETAGQDIDMPDVSSSSTQQPQQQAEQPQPPQQQPPQEQQHAQTTAIPSTNNTINGISQAVPAAASAPAPTPMPPQPQAHTPSHPPSRNSPHLSANVPAHPLSHGAPTRVYLNQKVTPTLLEAMKHLVTVEPEKPLKWLSEFLAQKSRELEGE